MFVFAAAEGASETSGLDVVVPPLYEVFYSTLIALLLLLVIGKFALPKIYAMLDDRADQIKAGLNAADDAKAHLASAERERTDVLREANAEAQKVRAQATEDAKRIVAQARADAQEEAQRVTEAAQRQILADRQAAQISLKTDVGLMATELAEKIVGEHLKDTALTERVVDRFIADLEKDTTPIETGTAK